MKGDTIYFLHNGNGQPVGMLDKDKDDLSPFRCKMARFVWIGLCIKTQVYKTLYVK